MFAAYNRNPHSTPAQGPRRHKVTQIDMPLSLTPPVIIRELIDPLYADYPCEFPDLHQVHAQCNADMNPLGIVIVTRFPSSCVHSQERLLLTGEPGVVAPIN